MMRRMRLVKANPARGAAVCSASMLLYLAWLLLPALQTMGGARAGAFCVAMFALGLLLDLESLKNHWWDLAARAVCAAAMPILLKTFLWRGGSNFAGYYVQQAMFWFPLIFAGYARRRGDARLWRWLGRVMLAAVLITLLTTVYWLVEGMLRGGRVYAYSRSLGYAGDVNPAYLKELMQRNIGGYDFVYAMVLAIPLACIGVQRHAGWKRWAYIALTALMAVMIVLSQYTYAMLYAAAILFVEIAGLAVRRISKGKIGMGKSLLIGAAPIVLVLLFIQPLVSLAASVCGSLGLEGFERSFTMLLGAFGGEAAADSRLAYYLTALEGFTRSPFVGSLFSADKRLSLHSEVLDLLSGMGILGTAAVGGMIWVMGRGLLRGVKQCPYRAHLCLMGCALFVTALLGTVNYSRDIMAVFAIGTLLVMEGEKQMGE